ncbi:FYVE and coiled-coil domain-containing protein 1-like isoform X2 [Styela clava]
MMTDPDWSIISNNSNSASRNNTPRILKDIQDITSKLFDEFVNSGDPITDDNHVLHRLCVKLEYLLQTCMKEKTLLGGNKHYWHWMYDSLKRTKGLADGLKYVRANKEVRSSQGRGRALIRYWLVHQTLADSFQNCLMNQSTCIQYLKSMCILSRPSYITLFLNALYEINAVNFDLVSKGYDLDSAWPTFASKRYPVTADQWRAPADRTSSLGSLTSYVSHMTSASLMMENPQIRGIQSGSSVLDGSSGPPSVDPRVEELVLELNESDQKIQEQQEALKRLENEANSVAKSAGEKQDILARVISDLESRNQSMEEAMSQMTTEFQIREQEWESKYRELENISKETDEKNSALKSRISVLEEDKRNLEDTVSVRMSLITSGFSGTSVTSISPSTSTENLEHDLELQEKLLELQKERQSLEGKVSTLQTELKTVLESMENEKRLMESSLSADFENREKELQKKYTLSTDAIVQQLLNVLPMEMLQTTDEIQTPNQQMNHILTKITELVNEFSNLRHESKLLQNESLLQKFHGEEQETQSSQYIEKCNMMQEERDDALTEVKSLSEKLVEAYKEQQNLKLKLESAISNHQRDILQLKDSNFHLQENIDKESMTREKLAEDLKLLQQKNDNAEIDLKNYTQRCKDLQEQLMERNEKRKISGKEESTNMEKIKDLEENVQRLEKEAEEEGKLYDQCINENEKLLEKERKFEDTIDALQKELNEMKTLLQALEQDKNSLEVELTNEKSKVLERLQEFMNVSSAINSATEAVGNTEKQFQILTENLDKKEMEDASFQMNVIRSCIESERIQAKKEYDELNGENESRKRMIISFEKKLENLENENAELVQNKENVKELQGRLLKAEEEKKESSTSYRAIEQEFIKMAEKLEAEREDAIKLKDEISQGLKREDNLKIEMEEMQSVSSELKAKLIQLLQEKDALWKECDELRYLQKLQEEGEGVEGKWMEDQEARYCLYCGTQFNFIIRKHHCRLCGKIFCNDCSKQWIITKKDGKHERCCLSCLELHKKRNEIKSLTSKVSSQNMESSPIKGVATTMPNDTEFDSITDEELNDSIETETPHSSNNDSIFHTPNAKMSSEHSRDSIASLPSDNIDSLSDESQEAVVAAGDFLKVPIHVKTPGTTLLWKFSSDRSIDFQLSYASSEESEEHNLIPRCRCDSHSEPVQGKMVSKQSGIYTFEFDNRFSRFNSKSVNYSLQLKEPSQQ